MELGKELPERAFEVVGFPKNILGREFRFHSYKYRYESIGFFKRWHEEEEKEWTLGGTVTGFVVYPSGYIRFGIKIFTSTGNWIELKSDGDWWAGYVGGDAWRLNYQSGSLRSWREGKLEIL